MHAVLQKVPDLQLDQCRLANLSGTAQCVDHRVVWLEIVLNCITQSGIVSYVGSFPFLDLYVGPNVVGVFHHGFKSRTSASFVMSRLLKTTLYIDSFISSGTYSTDPGRRYRSADCTGFARFSTNAESSTNQWFFANFYYDIQNSRACFARRSEWPQSTLMVFSPSTSKTSIPASWKILIRRVSRIRHKGVIWLPCVGSTCQYTQAIWCVRLAVCCATIWAIT